MSCHNGKRLPDAETYVQHIESEGTSALAFSATGARDAVPLFENMSRSSTGNLPYLNFYGDIQAKDFEAILHEEFDAVKLTLTQPSYTNPIFIQAARRVFWRYGLSLRGQDERSRRISTTIMLYALLPLWKKGCTSASFFPAAFLPNKYQTQHYLLMTKTLQNDHPATLVVSNY